MHLGNVFKERKLGVALSSPVLSKPDLPWFWVQFNFGKEKDKYVCCLGQGTQSTKKEKKEGPFKDMEHDWSETQEEDLTTNKENVAMGMAQINFNHQPLAI